VELETVSKHLNTVSAVGETAIKTWENVIEEGKRHRDIMFKSLEKYKRAVERAQIEIENSKVAAADVLVHKQIVEEYIGILKSFQELDDGNKRLGGRVSQ
jgi:hypothetical protein